MMILSILRKYSRFFAGCAVLGGMIAAPYLVPVNPDSAVFRSGTLGAIILLFSYFSVRHAIHTHSLRALFLGCVLAWILAVCLGIRCELVVYGSLLPGKGSLLRRLAVPVLVTPLLGTLFSFVFSHASSLRINSRLQIPSFVLYLLFALCYAVLLLALVFGLIS